VAVKSGWDEYGIAYGLPSSNITIRRVSGSSPFAGIAIGSETSGGVENVLAEHINLYKVGIGIHIKTNSGRGGFIKNITVSHVYMEDARKGIRISGDVGDHPDDKFDPNALPLVKGVTIKNVWGVKVLQAGLIQGVKNSPFTDICLYDINLGGVTGPRNPPWKCSDVSGFAHQVSPWPCSELSSSQQGSCANYSWDYGNISTFQALRGATIGFFDWCIVMKGIALPWNAERRLVCLKFSRIDFDK